MNWALDNFWLLFVVAIIFNVVVVLFFKFISKSSIPTKPTENEMMIFEESGSSGFSRKSIISKLGGARNCLRVVVTNEAIYISPISPFNWILVGPVASLYDLQHHILRTNLVSLKAVEADQHSVDIEYHDNKGILKSMQVSLKNRDQFMGVVNVIA
jgi:hypothetical protein